MSAIQPMKCFCKEDHELVEGQNQSLTDQSNTVCPGLVFIGKLQKDDYFQILRCVACPSVSALGTTICCLVSLCSA